MKRWGAINLGCPCLVLLASGAEGFVTPFALRAKLKTAAGRGRRQTGGRLSMIIPKPEPSSTTRRTGARRRMPLTTTYGLPSSGMNDGSSTHSRQPQTLKTSSVKAHRKLSSPMISLHQYEPTAVMRMFPGKSWGYVCEELNDFPEYEPNMDVLGEAKPGSTPEAFPAEELPIDDFEHGGAFECEFHDMPSLERPCFMGMKAFIDQEGLALLPSEAEMLEQDVQVERKRRAEARKERFADEPDEDLVDDTLDDVPLGTDVMVTDATPPSVDFDENDAYDDGYESVEMAGISGEEAMY